MRVTFVLPGYGWSPIGGYRVVYELASGLTRRGHQVTVVHPRRLRGVRRAPPATPLRRLVRPLGDLRSALRHHFGRPSPWWQAIDPAVRLRYVAEPVAGGVPEADAVFATAWQTVAYVAAYPASRGRPFYLVQDFPPYLGDAETLARTWRLPATKVAVSSWLEALVREAGGEDVVTVANGIGAAFGQRAPIEERARRVALMVSLATYKAWADAIEALRAAKRQVPELEAELYGGGPAPAGLEPWMRYHRNLKDDAVAALMNRAAVFLCSSRLEGFALPPAEAMACGCAVVTTDCGGNRDYATHGETALVSPPDDPEALAANLVRVLRDDALRTRLARAGQERITRFTWDAAAERLEGVLEGRVGASGDGGTGSGRAGGRE